MKSFQAMAVMTVITVAVVVCGSWLGSNNHRRSDRADLRNEAAFTALALTNQDGNGTSAESSAIMTSKRASPALEADAIPRRNPAKPLQVPAIALTDPSARMPPAQGAQDGDFLLWTSPPAISGVSGIGLSQVDRSDGDFADMDPKTRFPFPLLDIDKSGVPVVVPMPVPVSEPTPESAAWVFVELGCGAIGLVLRRRGKEAKKVFARSGFFSARSGRATPIPASRVEAR